MGPLEVFLILVYLVPIGFVANYAQRKGYNWYLFALLGLMLSWVVSLVIAVVADDKRAGPTRAEPENARVERLKDLAALRESGALTEEEFQAEKARLIGGEH